MKEDKALILQKLCETLQITRNMSNLVSLEYVKNCGTYEEAALATVLREVIDDDDNIVTRKCHELINISCDSGTAIIKDVLRHFGFLAY